MDHSMYKEKLSALLDGELQGAEREEALAHMDGCADCRAYFAELAALHDALADWEEFDAPGNFAAGVMARLHEENGRMTPRGENGEMTPVRGENGRTPPRAENNETATKARKKRFPRRGYAAIAACAAVILSAVYALPDMLRMGGNQSVAADSASSAVYASPAEAPAAPAPSPGSGYDYAGGSGGDPGDMARESAKADERDEVVTETVAVPADNRVTNGTSDGAAENGAPNSESYVSAITMDGDEKLSIGDSVDTPMSPMSRPEAYDDELPILTLSGEGAALWLAENGRRDESGAWYADAAALRALPNGLAVSDGELPEDYDGAVRVELGEAGQ